jgi:hypothetical protein
MDFEVDWKGMISSDLPLPSRDCYDLRLDPVGYQMNERVESQTDESIYELNT